MDCETDVDPGSSAQVRLLRELTTRLQTAGELSATVRHLLNDGDAVAIDAATARLEVVTEEFRVLAGEYDRLPIPADRAASNERLEREQSAMVGAAAALARSSAVTGGLLERMVSVSRGLLDLLALSRDGTYESSGRVAEPSASGVKLQERA